MFQTPNWYSGKALDADIGRMLGALEEAGFVVARPNRARPNKKTKTLVLYFHGVEHAYINPESLRKGVLGLNFAASGRQTGSLPRDSATQMVKDRFEKFGCSLADADIVYGRDKKERYAYCYVKSALAAIRILSGVSADACSES